MTLLVLPRSFHVSSAGLPYAGALLYTYRAGTTTPLTVYTTNLLAVAHSNPVEADANSIFPAVYADPSSYDLKYQLKTSADVLIYEEDNIPVSVTLTANTVGLALYPRTAAEIAAVVTPTYYYYPPGDVRRYGALGDGSDDTIAIQKAITVAVGSGGRVYFPTPSTTYLVTGALNATFATSANQHSVVFEGDGTSGDYPTITAKHTGHIFDLSGLAYPTFRDLSIGTDTVTYPKTCFFVARNSTGGSLSQTFDNVRFQGRCSKTVLYNYGSEDDTYSNCAWFNHATDVGASVAVFTAYNIQSLSSTFITIATGNRSTIDHKINGGQFYMDSTDTTADCFKLDAMLDLKIDKSWIDCRGRSYFYCDMTNGASSAIHIRDVQGENSTPLPTYGIAFSNHAVTPTAWTIADSYLPSATRAIYAPALPILDTFHVRQIREQAAKGFEVAGTLQNSTVDFNSVFVFATSKQNMLYGDTSNWTITTRNNDYWFDRGATNKTWTPGTGALTITGALTVSNKKVACIGSMVSVTVSLNAVTSIVCANGIAITGLPFAAAVQSAFVDVTNTTTGASIGNGWVSGTSIKLPAINVGTDTVSISAWYYAA